MPNDVKELQLLLTHARGKVIDAENELAFLRANEHRLREENTHLHERADRLSLELIESVSFSVRVTLTHSLSLLSFLFLLSRLTDVPFGRHYVSFDVPLAPGFIAVSFGAR